jgi:hypothetical protein
MALPRIFASLPAGNTPASYLDDDFAALGAISLIPCSASGLNSYTLVPFTGAPALTAYNQLQGYSFVCPATSTSGVSINVQGASGLLGSFAAYKATTSGPATVGSGDLLLSEMYIAFYDVALNGGSGGFHAFNIATAGGGGGNATVNSISLWNYFI